MANDLDRPWLLLIAPRTPPTGPRSLRWLDRALGALAETGLDGGERINVATTLSGYAVSQATLALEMSSEQEPAGDTAITGLVDYGEILAEVLDPRATPRCPLSSMPAASGTPRNGSTTPTSPSASTSFSTASRR